MRGRANVLVIHSWDDADLCRRLEELLRASDPELAHYSVPPERAIEGDEIEVAESIEGRIRFATAVVVINSRGLHRRETATFEMLTAVRLAKRIVVVQPDKDFYRPIPAVLDGHVYRFARWRSDVVGRAIRGEYPHDTRVFDIAEVADRRLLVAALSAGVGMVSFAILARTAEAWACLNAELKAERVELNWTQADSGAVLKSAVVGAVGAGVVTALVADDSRSALYAAAAGAIVGAALSVRRAYRARVLGARDLRILTVAPVLGGV